MRKKKKIWHYVLYYLFDFKGYWPGVLCLYGEITLAKDFLLNICQIREAYGFVPEKFNLQHNKVMIGSEGYPVKIK